MNKRRGKENPKRNAGLVNFKDLERNVLNEIASEFQDTKKNKDSKKDKR